MRSQHQHLEVRPIGGINQQEDIADWKVHLSDATNVWAPNGKLEVRPGSYALRCSLIGSNFNDIFQDYRFKESVGVFSTVTAWTSLAVNDYMYFGWRYNTWTTDRSNSRRGGLQFTQVSTNATAARISVSYWNGTEWHSFPQPGLNPNTQFMSDIAMATTVVIPSDIALRTVFTSGEPAYWIRCRMLNTAVTVGTDAQCEPLYIDSGTVQTNIGYFVATLSTLRLYFQVIAGGIAVDTVSLFSSSLESNITPYPASTYDFGSGIEISVLPTLAVVPQFDEVYLTYNQLQLVFTPDNAYTVSGKTSFVAADTVATVEIDDSIVGTNGPYPTDKIAQLQSWPRGNLLVFFKNRLWSAGDLTQPFSIQWGEPAPYHRVWPLLNIENLSEDDNSGITALAPLGEYMVVFKRDSIWIMVPSGLNRYGLETFIPQRVVAGVGCVAPGSIQKVQNTLVFLAEDGLYQFDGQNAKRIGHPVAMLLRGIDFSAVGLTSSVNWKARSLYLMSLRTTGRLDDFVYDTQKVQDEVIAWDYSNDTWWHWTGLDVVTFFTDEGADDKERCCYSNTYGDIFELKPGYRADNGAPIAVSVTTQKLNYGSPLTSVVRSVELFGAIGNDNTTVEVLSNDETSGTSGVVKFSTGVRWDSFSWKTPWPSVGGRIRRMDFRKSGRWHRIKLTASVKHQPWSISNIDVSMLGGIGKR